MPEEPKPQYFCPECQAGLTEDDILDGLAVRRFDEVYCYRHFKEKFPDECEEHPGKPVSGRCSRCGRPICDDCAVELVGRKFCRTCKLARVHELRTGQPEEQVEEYPFEHDSRRKSSLPVWIFTLSILGITVCGVLSVVSFILYFVYRRKVARGEILPGRLATAGFIISLIALGFVFVMIVIAIAAGM